MQYICLKNAYPSYGLDIIGRKNIFFLAFGPLHCSSFADDISKPNQFSVVFKIIPKRFVVNSLIIEEAYGNKNSIFYPRKVFAQSVAYLVFESEEETTRICSIETRTSIRN